MQVVEEALAVVQRCQQCEQIKQLWSYTPLPQPQQQAQPQRAVGKPAEVSSASPVKQQGLQQQQQSEDVKEVRDVGRLQDV